MKINIEKLIEDGEVVFLVYLSFINQPIVSSMIEALEKMKEGDKKIDFSQNLFVIFIEITQNIMHYGENDNYKAFIFIGREKETGNYYILSKNVVSNQAKERIERSLNEIKELDKKEIKKLYRERRKSGKDSHTKGAGIGFLEIAKLAKKIEFDFEDYKNKYIFSFQVYLKGAKK